MVSCTNQCFSQYPPFSDGVVTYVSHAPHHVQHRAMSTTPAAGLLLCLMAKAGHRLRAYEPIWMFQNKFGFEIKIIKLPHSNTPQLVRPCTPQRTDATNRFAIWLCFGQKRFKIDFKIDCGCGCVSAPKPFVPFSRSFLYHRPQW